MLIELLLSLSAGSIMQGSAQSQTIVQSTSGWCSPVFANVSGPVTVNCNGVDPRAVRVLNQDLAKSKADLSDALTKANDFAGRYFQIKNRLSTGNSQRLLRKKALRFLESGDVGNAGLILDRILSVEERDSLPGIAGDEYARGNVFELQGNNEQALVHLERAFSFDPRNYEYSGGYGKLLVETRRFTEAEPVLIDAYTRVELLASHDRPRYLGEMASIKLGLGDAFRHTDRSPEAQEAYGQALRLLDEIGDRRTYQESLDIATIRANLANIYTEQLNPQDAAQSMETSVANLQALQRAWTLTYPKAPDPCGKFIARARANLAAIYSDLGRYSEAEQILIQSLSFFKGLSAKDQAEFAITVAESQAQLAEIYKLNGKMDKAESYAELAAASTKELATGNPSAYEVLYTQSLLTKSSILLMEKN